MVLLLTLHTYLTHPTNRSQRLVIYQIKILFIKGHSSLKVAKSMHTDMKMIMPTYSILQVNNGQRSDLNRRSEIGP
jgi:hypothetical protein